MTASETNQSEPSVSSSVNCVTVFNDVKSEFCVHVPQERLKKKRVKQLLPSFMMTLMLALLSLMM